MTEAEKSAEKEFARKVFLEQFEKALASETNPETIARLKRTIATVKNA